MSYDLDPTKLAPNPSLTPSGPGLPKPWPTASVSASAPVSVPVSVTHTYTVPRYSESQDFRRRLPSMIAWAMRGNPT